MENKQKHLEFIQAVINRMAGNSFLLKGWAVTLVAALFALSAKDTNNAYISIAYFPTIVFWVLDGYFLSQERLFRSLYDHVRNLTEKDIDFSMDTAPFRAVARNGWAQSMFSRTLLWFYLSLVVVMWLVMFLVK
jgi:hypothetical protein